MAIKYILEKKRNPQDPAAAYYGARIHQAGKQSFNELVDDLASESSRYSSVVVAILFALDDIIRRHLIQGKIVKLGEFGSFYMTIHGKNAPSVEDWRGRYIRKASVRFCPGRGLKDALRKGEFERVER